MKVEIKPVLKKPFKSESSATDAMADLMGDVFLKLKRYEQKIIYEWMGELIKKPAVALKYARNPITGAIMSAAIEDLDNPNLDEVAMDLGDALVEECDITKEQAEKLINMV
jgi:hypothetical protein